jgi:pimeloyl-ACP methyl ester carboxylesterase
MIAKNLRATLKRIFWVFVPAVVVLAVGVGSLTFYFIHRLTHPQRLALHATPRDFQIILEQPMWFDEKWKNADSTQTVGWFLSQGKPAPGIIVSHGYGSNRSEMITLGFELWKAGFHVVMYDLRGHGESPVKWSGVGTYEKDDLLSAIKFLKNRKNETGQDLLDGRIGLYGVNVGGYASLVASAQSPAVRAVAVDSVYETSTQFLSNELKALAGKDSSLANSLIEADLTNQLAALGMQLYLLRREDSSPALESVSASAGRRFLFITSQANGAYDQATRQLFERTKDQKELFEVTRSRVERLYDQDLWEYDMRVVSFFKEAMPIAPSKPEKPVAKAAATRPRKVKS